MYQVYGYPEPQGPFYCGVGNNKVFGRDLVEDHTKACIEAGLSIYGTNAEVMPGQWEFQIGYRGIKSEKADVFTLSDQLWIARFLLHRLAESYNIKVSFENKPVKCDWNGAGCHTNFSTRKTRNKDHGLRAINECIELLSKKHSEHVTVYGYGLNDRLTGLHETCSINEFRSGVSDRGASIRVPVQVNQNGFGYFEDHRPGANCDPYLVSARLVATVENLSESLFNSISSQESKKQSAECKHAIA